MRLNLAKRVLIIVVTLTPILHKSMLQRSFESCCSYSTYTGNFTFRELNFKGRDFATCLRLFEDYKRQNKKDTILYRLFQKRHWKVWKYPQYIFSKKYKLEYIAWEGIRRRRGTAAAQSQFLEF